MKLEPALFEGNTETLWTLVDRDKEEQQLLPAVLVSHAE
jgi:hypothetical protein